MSIQQCLNGSPGLPINLHKDSLTIILCQPIILVMVVASLAKTKAQLSSLVDEIVQTHEQVTVTRNGEPAVVILSVDDFAEMEETLALLADSAAQQRIATARQEFARGEYVTGDKMAALMQARAEREGNVSS